MPGRRRFCSWKIGEIMGVDARQRKKTAFVKCGGTCEKTKSEYEYYGIKDCIMASQMQDGGAKGCAYGCLGYAHAWMPVRLMQSIL